MKRTELKKKLENPTPESRRLYRNYPHLYRDLILWEDYLQCVAQRRKEKIHAPKDRARNDILSYYGISEKTFYAIRRTLRALCSDV
ncbi:MAG: hypothetical protein J5688_05515 [Paludibacteraceae bacterium]|nr:hypothetical protein [Paludibacteraceae bacterium]